MRLGMVGLGRMGMNMTRRLIRGGHEVVVLNRTPEKVEKMVGEGAIGSSDLADMVSKLESPKIVWIMIPAGKAVDEQVLALSALLTKDDIVIDGGNSFFKDDYRHAEELKEKGIHYLDAGVSGGIWGLEVGYCTMVGGEKDVFETVEPVFKTLAPENGYMYCGPTGAGHFVKMVHNGIEYGMMQAYAEGFELLNASEYGDGLDMSALANLWNQGSVVRSWLLELLESAFKKDPSLSSIAGYVEDSGEGRWTVQQAVETGVSLPVITASLFRRFESRTRDTFSNKILAALRKEFGGHAVKSRTD